MVRKMEVVARTVRTQKRRWRILSQGWQQTQLVMVSLKVMPTAEEQELGRMSE